MCEVDERYKRGKIYTIRNIADDTMIYVGSTINTLPKRFNRHKEQCKSGQSCSLYNYITDNDWVGWYIELFEAYNCNNRDELVRKEGEVIRKIGTINKNIAGRTNKEWYEENKEAKLEQHKKWYQDNKEVMLKYAKKYYKDNNEVLLEKRKEKICCDICGALILKVCLKRHKRSTKCLSVANKIFI